MNIHGNKKHIHSIKSFSNPIESLLKNIDFYQMQSEVKIYKRTVVYVTRSIFVCWGAILDRFILWDEGSEHHPPIFEATFIKTKTPLITLIKASEHRLPVDNIAHKSR